ncbi:peptidoglycan-binding protein LysM [Veillonellaceae bacterium M2-4]|nr:peptidoglycan-binding protein LysM [Veillonellaceae bacterium M2-4]
MKRVHKKATYTIQKRMASLFCLCGFILVVGSQLGWVSPAKDMTYVTVQVHEGDTLWHYAHVIAVQQEDVRPVVDRIVTINGLQEDESLQPGQMLKIPVLVTQADEVRAKLNS